MTYLSYGLGVVNTTKLVAIPFGQLAHAPSFALYSLRLAPYSYAAMWNVDEHLDAKIIDALPAIGFNVRSTGGVVRIEKYGCAAEVRKTPDGRYQMTLLPAVLVGGQFTRLWDAGYQKFLLADDGRKFPAVAAQLSNLRQFNEELRKALGVPTFYNEALGSTCHVTTYDRVKGRPGDVPDQSVGAKSSNSH